MLPRKYFVAIAGNIGSGKSSLTKKLSKSLGFIPFYEPVEENPYLSDFYKDMKRWAFHLQVFFLSSRFKMQQQIIKIEESAILDRTIYEDVNIFAKNLKDMQVLDNRDHQNYTDLYAEMDPFLRPPDLLLYLKASVPTLVKQIQQRGRSYESKISIDYLESLNFLYNDWVAGYDKGPKIIINIDEIDFIKNEEDYGTILKLVDQRLFGMF